MFAYPGTMEDETKELVQYYYDELCFIQGKVHSIEKEYTFSDYSRADFLIETEDEYIIVECKGKADDTNIGQVLRYMGLLKKEEEFKDKAIKPVLFAHKATQHLLTSIDVSHNIIQVFTWERLLNFEIDNNNEHINALVYLIYSLDRDNPSQKLTIDFRINKEHLWGYLKDVQRASYRLTNTRDIDEIIQSLRKEEDVLKKEKASFDEKITELEKKNEKKIEIISEEYFQKDEELTVEREKFHRQVIDHFLQDNIADELRHLLASIHEERNLLEEAAKKLGINHHNSKTLKSFQKSLIKHL